MTERFHFCFSHYFANKGSSSQGYGFSIGHYGCESRIVKEAERRRIDAFELWVLEKTLESPLDYKEIQPVNPNGNQSVLNILWKD